MAWGCGRCTSRPAVAASGRRSSGGSCWAPTRGPPAAESSPGCDVRVLPSEDRALMSEGSKYEAVIGLECHVQLATASKMFCGCSADYAGAAPNTRVCPVCLGMPGVLPVINRRAVEFTLRTGLALHAEVPEATKFDRKNYPYPDLVKGYQISQYDLPLVTGGWVEITAEDGQPRRIGLERVHLEEDTGKLTHTTDAS